LTREATEESDELLFSNTYETPVPSEPAPVQIAVKKDIKGIASTAEEFTFTLTQVDRTGEDEEVTYTETQGGQSGSLTVAGGASDSFDLEPLWPGAWYFLITEDRDDPLEDWDYDESEYVVEVVVTWDPEEGYEIDVRYPGGASLLTFANTFISTGFDFVFHKTDERGLPMAGVEFQLYTCNDPAHTAAQDHTPLGDEEGCWELPQTAISEAQNVETVEGRVLFEGLPSGTYLLAETATHPGYQLPHAQWLVRIEAGGDPEVEIEAFGGTPPGFMLDDGALYLANYPVLTLPRAGSVTMLLFSAGGAAMLGGAGVLTATGIRKRKLKA